MKYKKKFLIFFQHYKNCGRLQVLNQSKSNPKTNINVSRQERNIMRMSKMFTLFAVYIYMVLSADTLILWQNCLNYLKKTHFKDKNELSNPKNIYFDIQLYLVRILNVTSVKEVIFGILDFAQNIIKGA